MTQADFDLMVSFGGRLVGPVETISAYGLPQDKLKVWDFGYLDPARRTSEEEDRERLILRSIPRFVLSGRDGGDSGRAFLWESARKCNNGKDFPAFRQETGSSVGQALGQCVWHLAACDAVLRGDPDAGRVMPFWLLAYGWSRSLLGRTSRGEGATAAAAVRAALEWGFPPSALTGLPQPWAADGVCYGRAKELEWSYGPQQPRGEWDGGRQTVLSVGRCLSHDDVRDALRNDYPCLLASTWGGAMRPTVEDGVLLNRKASPWLLALACVGWWDHPAHGEIFYVLTPFGGSVHGECPSGAPAGGFWVGARDMDFMCRDEAFALSQWEDGFRVKVA